MSGLTEMFRGRDMRTSLPFLFSPCTCVVSQLHPKKTKKKRKIMASSHFSAVPSSARIRQILRWCTMLQAHQNNALDELSGSCRESKKKKKRRKLVGFAAKSLSVPNITPRKRFRVSPYLPKNPVTNYPAPSQP